MEKENYSQLDLFSQERNYSSIKTQKLHNSLLRSLRIYEKTIFMIIGFIVTAIISFSLGVEKGKRISAIKTNSRFDLASQILPQKAQIKTIDYDIKIPAGSRIPDQSTLQKQNIIRQPELQEYLHNYTIQLASYRNKASIEKEARALRGRGLTPLILPKGKYMVLYVGNFSNRKTAEALALKLKKRYQDCLVRRL